MGHTIGPVESKGTGMRKMLVVTSAIAMAAMAGTITTAAANEGPKKVWLCHFEENHAPVSYTDDRNGDAPGFWTTGSNTQYAYEGGEHLDGDYVVRYNDDSYPGIPAGLNAGQIALCTGNGGEFITVSQNSVGSDEDVRGHRAQNLWSIATYPEGWNG